MSLLILLMAASSEAAIYISVPDALRKAFPNAVAYSDQRIFLTEEQKKAAEKKAGERIPFKTSIFTQFKAQTKNEVLGFAYLDSHLVRTMPETLLISLTPSGQVISVEIIAFKEPPEYMAPEKWRDQFKGKELSPELSLKNGIHGITGATLTAQSFEASVRRVLALHHVLEMPK